MNTATRSSLEHIIGVDGLLAVRLRSGEVRLHAVDGEAVRVRDVNGHDLDEMLAIEARPGSLSLSQGRGLEIVLGPRTMRRGHGRHTPELEIDLPRRATLVFEAESGDVEGDGLLGDQRYRTASGDIVLRAVSGRISIEAISGDIDIGATDEAQISARSVSGDIALRAATLSALELTTTSGDLKVAGRLTGPGPFAFETVSGDGLLAPASDVRIEMASVTGDLTSDLKEPQVTSRGRHALTIGSTGPLVTFRSMSGDLHVVAPMPVTTLEASKAHPSEEPVRAEASPTNGAIAAAYDDARLRILRSLERGEIDVVEAGRRLETLDTGDVSATGRVERAAGEHPATAGTKLTAGEPAAVQDHGSNG